VPLFREREIIKMNKKFALMNLILCSIMHGINHYSLIFYKSMYPSMTAFFNLQSVSEITTRMVIMYVGYGISNFLSGVLSKKISMKFILFAGMLIMSISTIGVYFVPSNMYYLVVVFVFFMGFGGGTYHPAANTFVTASFDGKAGHVIGLLSVGSAIGFVLAPFVGEYIGEKLIGFQSVFLITGIIGALFSFVFLFMAKDFKSVDLEKPITGTGKKVLSGKMLVISIIILCIPITIREMTNWSFYEITPFWVKYGFSHGITVSLVQSMQYLPGIIVQPLAGKLCDKFGAKNVVLITFSMFGIGLILFSIPNIVVLWFAMILFGIGMSTSTVTTETFMAQMAQNKNRALVYGVVLSVGLGLGGFLAGFSGTIVDFFGKQIVTGYRVWYSGLGISVILSSLIFIIIDKNRMKSLQKD
jgi:MFS transporter, FSR family, fosmidomycin resistance protein